MSVVWRDSNPDEIKQKKRLKERREVPPCPKCAAPKAKRLEEINTDSELRWFRCASCSHVWSKGPRATD
jgi:formate dehydrogenase maturation protein FdhE